jgi:sulfonate transport system substrate-binding protein
MTFKPLRQLGLALLASALLPSLASAEQTLRIGYQKSSTLLTLLKARGSLEQRLQAEGHSCDCTSSPAACRCWRP